MDSYFGDMLLGQKENESINTHNENIPREIIDEARKENSDDEETVKRKNLEEKKAGLQKMKSGKSNNCISYPWWYSC